MTETIETFRSLFSSKGTKKTLERQKPMPIRRVERLVTQTRNCKEGGEIAATERARSIESKGGKLTMYHASKRGSKRDLSDLVFAVPRGLQAEEDQLDVFWALSAQQKRALWSSIWYRNVFLVSNAIRVIEFALMNEEHTRPSTLDHSTGHACVHKPRRVIEVLSTKEVMW
jgi:hypothetical protein